MLQTRRETKNRNPKELLKDSWGWKCSREKHPWAQVCTFIRQLGVELLGTQLHRNAFRLQSTNYLLPRAHLRCLTLACQMTQQVRVLAAKPGHLSWIPRTHTVGGENPLLHIVHWSCVHHDIYSHTSTQLRFSGTRHYSPLTTSLCNSENLMRTPRFAFSLSPSCLHPPHKHLATVTTHWDVCSTH